MTEERSTIERMHQGLREAMCQLIARMRDFPRGLADEREQLVDDLDSVLYLCESHAAQEDHVLVPMLERHDLALTIGLRRDRLSETQLFDRVREVCVSLLEVDAAREPECLLALFQSYAALVGHLLPHFEREECAMRTCLSEAERALVDTQLASTLGPDERISFNRVSQLTRSAHTAQGSQPHLTDTQIEAGLLSFWNLLSEPERKMTGVTAPAS